MMKLSRLNRNIRSFRRYRQIVSVLFSYGFDHLLDYLHVPPFMTRGRRFMQRDVARISGLTPPVRMRLALEELGPTFVKLGQVLSTRPDIVPETYAREFATLQDQVPSFPYAEVRTQIRGELGKEPEEIYAAIDETALAAASIAQVHRARLLTGEEVVIKVRRPDVVSLVESDIDALMVIAALAERHLEESRLYDPVGIVREFARVIRREMDFSREGHTIEKMAENFGADPTLHFPKVHWEQTSHGILTMEYIDGIKVSDLKELRRMGIDLVTVARNGADTFLKMVLEHGFFHGDPHPGNVLILPDNVICLLDYGMVGRVDPGVKSLLVDLLVAIIHRDMDEVVSILLYSGDIAEPFDARRLKRDLGEFIDGYYEIPLKDIEVGRMIAEFLEIITTYHIKFQPDLMLMAKALMTVEGMGRTLDPEFDMVDHLRPFVERAIRERVTPRTMSRDLRSIAGSYLGMVKNLPRDLKTLINRINHDKFKIDLEHRGLDQFTRELDKSINRLSSSLIMAALIVGSSLIMQTDKGPQMFGFPAFGFLGYTIAGILGLWWVIAIIRSGRL
jgi:ubiquinone biosynthesis protein